MSYRRTDEKEKSKETAAARKTVTDIQTAPPVMIPHWKPLSGDSTIAITVRMNAGQQVPAGQRVTSLTLKSAEEGEPSEWDMAMGLRRSKGWMPI